MKKLATLLFSMMFAVAMAQDPTSGEVIYEEVMNTKPNMKEAEKQGWAQWAAMVPESMTFEKKLTYSADVSWYQFEESDGVDDMDHMQKRMRRRYSQKDNQTYRNLKEKNFVEQRDFMGKIFLIEGEPETIKWKVTGESKMILNYPCMRATYTDSTGITEAWFTPSIPVSVGPEKYGQLPGLILQLTSEKDKKTLTAVSIEFKPVAEGSIEKPTKGKKVTRQEYRKIVMDKMKEMRQNRGRGGRYH